MPEPLEFFPISISKMHKLISLAPIKNQKEDKPCLTFSSDANRLSTRKTMSKINNHGVGMNKINLAGDFQELTCEQAAAIQGGAEIIVYTDANFGGSAFSVVAGNAGEQFQFTGEFDNSISSAKVLSGTWELVTVGDGNGGFGVTLGPGEYSSLDPTMNDTISLAIATIA